MYIVVFNSCAVAGVVGSTVQSTNGTSCEQLRNGDHALSTAA